ncbi:MAG: response regulator [Myxococcales bacterium FL481]|nr:MAG: response regulator [Myxococcales bacterium FL481]
MTAAQPQSSANIVNHPLSSRPELVHARVLLVEDDPMVAKSWLELLSRLRCRVVHARRAAEARMAIAETRRGFDAAVIDLSLPDDTGASLVPMLHGSPLPCATLLVSGLPSAIAVGVALAAEAHELAIKPVSTSDFTLRLASTVRATQQLRRGQPVRETMLAAHTAGPSPRTYAPNEPESEVEQTRAFYAACHHLSSRHRLTPAQVRILPGLVAGYDEPVIAQWLRCPVSDVRLHVRDLKRRLHVREPDELARLFAASYDGTGPWPTRTTSMSSSTNRSTVDGSGHR